MSWRTVLTSRFVVVPGALAVLAAAWNLYVALHNNGLVAGEVRYADGTPAAGVTVVLQERNFVTHIERDRTATDASGRFRFTSNRAHVPQLEAEAPDGRKSERRLLRLWFRSQDVTLDQPLVIGGRG